MTGWNELVKSKMRRKPDREFKGYSGSSIKCFALALRPWKVKVREGKDVTRLDFHAERFLLDRVTKIVAGRPVPAGGYTVK